MLTVVDTNRTLRRSILKISRSASSSAAVDRCTIPLDTPLRSENHLTMPRKPSPRPAHLHVHGRSRGRLVPGLDPDLHGLVGRLGPVRGPLHRPHLAGRTIREFIVGVMLVPTAFSIVWFGVFGGIGFHGIREGAPVLEVVERDVDATMFFVLDQFPVPTITTAAVVLAAFLFVVTSVVSASFVLGMFSTGGGLNPSRVVKLSWGV